jgi:hypothetical protein
MGCLRRLPVVWFTTPDILLANFINKKVPFIAEKKAKSKADRAVE